MDTKLPYQVEQLEDKLARLQTELDGLDKQVTEVEKNLLVLKGEASVVEQAVATITNNTGWLFKIIVAGFVTTIVGWIVAGGLAGGIELPL